MVVEMLNKEIPGKSFEDLQESSKKLYNQVVSDLNMWRKYEEEIRKEKLKSIDSELKEKGRLRNFFLSLFRRKKV